MIEEKQLLKDNITEFITNNSDWVIVLWWPTASWKTSLSLEIAKEIWWEVISADSRQIYKHMDIGTDKIDIKSRQWIMHHQIDIIEPDLRYTAWQWKVDAENLIWKIQKLGKIPMIVWWTWLYIDTIYKNFSMPEVAPDMEWREVMMQREEKSPWYLYKQLEIVDPDEVTKHHPNSTRYLLRALEIYEKTGTPKSVLAKELPVKRPLYMIWLWRKKEDTNKRINKRIKSMLNDEALIQENKKLLNMWYNLSHTAMNWIWYKEVIWYLQWEYDIDRCEELLKRNTHRYAKRQRSRFRRYIMDMKARPKDNVLYHLIEL